MAKNQIPDNKSRDAITNETKAGFGGGSGTASPKRADTLNGSPRTKSAGSAGGNYSSHKTSDAYNSAPPPNNPYSK